MNIRERSPADAATVPALFDEAVAWLVTRGQTGQCGSAPFSANDARVAAAAEWAASGGLRIARLGDEPVGAMVLGARPEHVSPALALP